MGFHFRDKKTGKIDYYATEGEKAAEKVIDGFHSAVMTPFSVIGDIVGRIFDNLLLSLGILLGVLIAVGLLVIVGFETGVLRSKMNLTLAQPAYTTVAAEDVSVITVCGNDQKVNTRHFNKDGVAKVWLKKRDYALYLSYDGMMDGLKPVYFGVVGSVDSSAQLQPVRAVQVQFFYEDGSPMTPEGLRLTDQNGTEIPCGKVSSDSWLFYLPEDAAGEAVTFEADGCQPLTVAEDWNSRRLGKLEVTFVE